MKYFTKLVAAPDNLSSSVIKKLAELDLICFGPEDHASLDLSESYWWFIYNEAGKVVAYSGLKLYPQACFLCRSGVLKEARGAGLQRRMIYTRERKAKKLGFKRIITYTSRFNAASANNIFKCGYKLYVPKIEWASSSCVYFEKLIF